MIVAAALAAYTDEEMTSLDLIGLMEWAARRPRIDTTMAICRGDCFTANDVEKLIEATIPT